jgi:nucleoside-diphosphate-sugar epimerase
MGGHPSIESRQHRLGERLVEMNILITGAAGYIGKFLTKYYTDGGHAVTAATRHTCDLLDSAQVKQLFHTHYDVVIHSALAGREKIHDPVSTFYADNITMFENLVQHQHMYGKFINLGSGHEYDINRNISYAQEEDILYVEPQADYGRAKNAIARRCLELPNFHTLRLFGLCHYTEPASRFFKKLHTNAEFHIYKDCYSDFINLEDLATIMDHVIAHDVDKQINCVYEQKYKLSELASIFCDIHNMDQKKIIVDGVSDNDYTGDHSRLAACKLPLLGLELAMLRY